jgi:hypothetical protein
MRFLDLFEDDSSAARPFLYGFSDFDRIADAGDYVLGATDHSDGDSNSHEYYVLKKHSEVDGQQKYEKVKDLDVDGMPWEQNNAAKVAFKNFVASKNIDEANYEVNPAQRTLADIGRKLMDKAATTKDDALSTALSRVGNELTSYGTPFGARSIQELEKKTGIKRDSIMKMLDYGKKMLSKEGAAKIADKDEVESVEEAVGQDNYEKTKQKTMKTFPNVKHFTKSGHPDWKKHGITDIPSKESVDEAYISKTSDAVNVLANLRKIGKSIERGQQPGYEGNLANMYATDVWDVYSWIESKTKGFNNIDKNFQGAVDAMMDLRSEAKKLETSTGSGSNARFGNQIVTVLYPVMQYIERDITEGMAESTFSDVARLAIPVTPLPIGQRKEPTIVKPPLLLTPDMKTESSETKYGIVRYPDTAISYIKNDGNGWVHIYDKSYGFKGPVDKADLKHAKKIAKEKIPSRMFNEGAVSGTVRRVRDMIANGSSKEDVKKVFPHMTDSTVDGFFKRFSSVDEGVGTFIKGAGIAALLGWGANAALDATSAKHSPLGKAIYSAAQAGDQEAATAYKNLDAYADVNASSELAHLRAKYLKK